MQIKNVKDHSKKSETRFNGYHLIGKINFNNSNLEVPNETEVQLWDINLDDRCLNGDLFYQGYKGNKKEVLSEREIRKMLKRKEFVVGYNIPYKYKIKDGKVTQMSVEETVESQYGIDLEDEKER